MVVEIFCETAGTFSTNVNVVIYYVRNTAFKMTAKRVIRSYIPCLGTPIIPIK